MKKLLITLLCCLALVGCGNTGISQEDYDKVVEERDKLQSENESIKRMSELEAKVAEYSATINAEYEHAKFVLYIGEKVSNTDTSESLKATEDLYNKTINSIDGIKSVFGTADSLSDMGDDTYNATVDSIEEIYNTWEETYSGILNIQKALTRE